MSADSTLYQYTLFYSWQNDRKDTKTIITAALNKVKKSLAVDGVELIIDQDTRNRIGKRNIDSEVLEKIRNCDIFLADLTPVTTYMPPTDRYDLPKHMPNSNVMYEYGYALHAKGENRMIVLASLNKEEDEHVEYMPFDINHDSITMFTDVKSLDRLYLWIRNIIKDVDEERAKQAHQYASTLLFQVDEGYSDEITIKPRYKKIYYTEKKQKSTVGVLSEEPCMVDIIINPMKMQQALLKKKEAKESTLVVAKVINKTTKLSYVPIHLFFFNQGSEALDNLHIHLRSENENVIFSDTNVDERLRFSRILNEKSTTINIDCVFQTIETLNPNSSYRFDVVFVHVPHDIGTFMLFWTLNSRSFEDNGKLIVHVEPEYEYDSEENDKLAGTEQVIDLVVEE